MSAICGIYNNTKEQPLPPDSLSEMRAALAHYGRDGSDTWQKGPIALGHQLTCVSPESRDEKLPSGSAGLTITADARLDNRESLIADLGLASGEDSLGDSTLILRAYQKRGLDCPQHLLGAWFKKAPEEAKRSLQI